MNDSIYLDHAATTRVAEDVAATMMRALGPEYGNPSSRHPLGSSAAASIEEARRAVAGALGTRSEGVLFTSGGTEANNLAVIGFSRALRRGKHGAPSGHILIGPTEHPSIRASAASLVEEGFEVEIMRLTPGDKSGGLDIADAASRLRGDTVLVAQMIVNNEYGTRYDIARLSRAIAARAPEAHLHVDAVQALGKIELDPAGLVDGSVSSSFAVSAHKIHGPKGAGALVLSNACLDAERLPRPIIHGGGQQGDVRPGTENVPGIMGFGTAIGAATRDFAGTTIALVTARKALEAALAEHVPAARVLIPWSDESTSSMAPQVVSVLVPGAPSEVWLHHLEEVGVFASAGSACQAKKQDLSPALLALGLTTEQARRVLRFSFSSSTTTADCIEAARRMASVAGSLARL
ncbi:MAG: cysteine desulfurase family protein [Planctomycetota bacterium]|nr:cysteine desulfurase family protein [Planctomycetota bacterium]